MGSPRSSPAQKRCGSCWTPRHTGRPPRGLQVAGPGLHRIPAHKPSNDLLWARLGAKTLAMVHGAISDVEVTGSGLEEVVVDPEAIEAMRKLVEQGAIDLPDDRDLTTVTLRGCASLSLAPAASSPSVLNGMRKTEGSDPGAIRSSPMFLKNWRRI